MSDLDAPASITNRDLAKLQEVINSMQHQLDAYKSLHIKGFNPGTPEYFDGKSTSQLRNFLTQVRVVFSAQPAKFSDDKSKVLYAASHLRGSAFTWAQPYLDMANPPAWMNDFSLFAAEINAVFGDPDLASNNFRRLKRLKQIGSVAAYTAEFRRLASQLSWSDQALVQQYFDGLKDSLQDMLIAANYPEELETLIRLAARMDNLQHQRRTQRGQEPKPAAPAQRKQQLPYVAARPQSVPLTRPAYNAASAPVEPSGPRPMELDATRPRFQRLTKEQKEHRRRNNLCMYCGEPSHFAQACPTRPKEPYSPARVSGTIFTATEPTGKAQTQQQY
jgi:Ty3 transposon capsid-like protein